MKNIIYEKLNTFHNLKNKTGHSNDCDRFATSLSRKLRENEGTRPGIYLHRKVIDLTKDL